MELLAGSPPQMMQADPNTGMRNAVAMQAAREYGQAQRDPNWGMLGPAQSKYMEDQLIDSVYNRLGSAAGSGPAKGAAARAVVEFRLAQMKERADQLARLRGDMLTATGAPMQSAALPGSPGVLTQMAAGMGGQQAGSIDWGKVFGTKKAQEPRPRASSPAPGGGMSVSSGQIYDV